MAVELQAPPQASAAAVANAKLVVPRNEALRVIKAQIERGLEIKRAKIRYVPELERAREAKGQWTNDVMRMLKGMYNTGAVADECQAWHGKVLPEYADLNLFIEHFYDEMDQRLRKLHTVWKRIQDLPEETPKPLTSAPAANPNPDFFEAATTPPPSSAPATSTTASSSKPRTGAFVVYQHDPRAQAAVRDFCTKLGFDVAEIAQDAQPDVTISAQLDQHPNLDFGLILSRADNPPKPFELGYCVGRLGLKRTFVLSATDDKLTVDEHGLLHIPLDPADGWQLHLARQLKRAGLEIDLNRVF
jgi:hypothetical protein